MRFRLLDKALDEGRAEFGKSDGTCLVCIGDELLSIGVARKHDS